MVIVHNPTTPLLLKKKMALAIGTFDGVHKGHQAIIQNIIDVAKKRDSYSAIVTYENHPSRILRPDNPVLSICTLTHKIELLEQTQLDYIILYNFDQNFASQTASQFLSNLMEISPFEYLNMGYDGKIGKNRTGDMQHLSDLSKKLCFDLAYTSAYPANEMPISSTHIRNYIREGNLKKAAELLGRPYSIKGYVVAGKGIGEKIGFPTANIVIRDLETPPQGVWAVEAILENKPLRAVANLGVAPTLHRERDIFLEVHIPDKNIDLYGKKLEVVFHQFLRPELCFQNIDELKQQLQQDINAAKTYFKQT